MFISAKLNQHAGDAGDIARGLTEEISQHQSHESPPTIADDTASTHSDVWDSWSDWLHTNLLDHDIPELDSTILVDLEQESNFPENINILPSPDGRLRVERIIPSCAGVPHRYEDVSLPDVSEAVSTIAPGAGHLASMEESERSESLIATHDTGSYVSSPKAAVVAPVRGRKTSKRRRVTRPQTSTEVEDTPHAKKRRLVPSAGRDVLSDAFARKLKKKDLSSVEDLVNLNLATASSDALRQLKSIFNAIRVLYGSTLAERPSTIAETLHMLDTLQKFEKATLFLRRIWLLKLWNLRKAIESKLKNGRKRRSEEIQPTAMLVGTMASNVMDDVMSEAFPEITPRPHGVVEIREWRKYYQKQRTSLRNWFRAAKKWHGLSERFSCGILALIPSGGEFNIQNHKYVNHCPS